MVRYKILLGSTETRDIIFGNVELRNRDGFTEFSASFDTVSPIVLNESDVKERIESQLDCYDSSDKLDLLERFDCAPSQLVDEMYDNSYDVIHDFYDNSLYIDTFEINGDTIFFESIGCGQHDTRDEIETLFVSQEFYDYIHELWDNYHLKAISSSDIEKLLTFINAQSEVDEDALIESWLTDIFV